jgi:hypothetical protein
VSKKNHVVWDALHARRVIRTGHIQELRTPEPVRKVVFYAHDDPFDEYYLIGSSSLINLATATGASQVCQTQVCHKEIYFENFFLLPTFFGHVYLSPLVEAVVRSIY